ncbi:AP2/ERF family transcription factor [Clostridioides difficile]|nr:AP2/ERF family transcription factor [Clostridioides difficile]MDI6389349.1 AP2/ERF family transcription factor [Clostridioides difficile]
MEIGDKFENLTILDMEQRNGRKYCLCKCKNCGNEKWIRADSLKRIKACGCMKSNTQFKQNDLTGKKFGRLTAIKSTNKKAKSGHYIWACKCDCGNKIEIIESSLTTGKTRSCGCLQKEAMRENMKLATKANKEKNIIENTNLALLKKTEAYPNSKTKVRGVYWDKSKNKYKAQIEFKKVHYNLGYYDNIEDAEKAYIEAKEKLHKKFLEEYNK